MGNKTPRQRRQIRNYLLDRKVQLRITLVMVAISCALTAVLGFCWYSEIRKASDVVRTSALVNLGEETARRLGAELAAQDQWRLLVLVGFAALFALLIAGYGIVMTHKIAGPVFKIGRHMSDIAENRLYPLWGLRRGDQLQAFFATFERMHGALRDRVEADMKQLSRLIAAIEDGGDLSGELEDLKAALKAKGDSLRQAGNVTQRIDRSGVTRS